MTIPILAPTATTTSGSPQMSEIVIDVEASGDFGGASHLKRATCNDFKPEQHGQHRNILVNDIRLHYVEFGDPTNPLMIFIHGFPELWWFWRDQLEYFAKSHWVIALDLRGYGESEKPNRTSDYNFDTLQLDIVGLVRGLGRSSAILVAHDWGGLIAWGVASNYPEVVSKLIVLNAAHPNNWLRPSRQSSMFQWLKSWYVLPFLIPYFTEAVLWAGLKLTFPAAFRIPGISRFAPPFTAQELSAYKRSFPRPSSWTPPLNYYKSYVRSWRRKAFKQLPKTLTPTLLIWGDKEVWLDSKSPEKCGEFAGDFRVQHIHTAGHFHLRTHAGEVNLLIEAFVGVD